MRGEGPGDWARLRSKRLPGARSQAGTGPPGGRSRRFQKGESLGGQRDGGCTHHTGEVEEGRLAGSAIRAVRGISGRPQRLFE